MPAGEEKTLPLFISFPPAFLTRGMVKATVELEAPDGEHKIETVTLLGPAAEVSHDEDSHHDGH